MYTVKPWRTMLHIKLKISIEKSSVFMMVHTSSSNNACARDADFKPSIHLLLTGKRLEDVWYMVGFGIDEYLKLGVNKTHSTLRPSIMVSTAS